MASRLAPVESVLARVNDALSTVYRVLGVGLLLLIVAVVTTNVIGRRFLGAPVVWSGEAASFALLWLVFLGATLGYRRLMFPAFLLGVESLPRRMATTAKLLVLVVNLGAWALLVWLGYAFAQESWGQLSPLLGLNRGHVYLIVPLAGVTLGLMTLEQVVRLLTGKAVATGSRGLDA